MSKKYLRWKNADCNGQNIEWEEMSGKDFFDFFYSDARKGRYFVVLRNDICREADVIFIEATKEQYDDWYREYCHHCYVNRYVPDESILSLDYPIESHDAWEDTSSLHDLIADVYTANVEDQAVKSALIEYLPFALNALTELSRKAIIAKYFEYPNASDAEVAETLGISENAFFKRRKAGLNALKKIFES